MHDNLKQIGTGLVGYVAEDDGRYPPPTTGGPNVIYEINRFDNRQNLKDIANGMTAEVWWCPLQTFRRPSANIEETEWSRDFYLVNFQNWHTVGYNIFFLITSDTAPGQPATLLQGDFEHMTNPDLDGDGLRDGPYEPGNSDSAVVADANVDWKSGCFDWERPYYASHVDIERACIAPSDSDVLFGDGHVTMTTKLKYYYLRYDPARGTYVY